VSTYRPLPSPSPEARERLLQLLERTAQSGASDLHLTVGEPPRLRSQGLLELLSGESALTPDELAALASATCDEAQRRAFASLGSLDLALSSAAGHRFRINLFRERGHLALSIRRLDDQIRSLADLHLPPQIGDLADLQDGLVLFVGATGSGKTTTLATLIDRINAQRAVHILTLEDPIEYLHPSRRALVRQRQLHTDFDAFAQALRAALREDPDVILVGELRDQATMRAALTAGETGHLVFATLHASSATSASERFVGAFGDQERSSVRNQLSYVLRAVVSQRLLRRSGGGRVPVAELLKVTSAVANLIRSGRPALVQSALESGAQLGMLTLEASLARLVQEGLISTEQALQAARAPDQVRERLRRKRSGTSSVAGSWQ